MKNPNRFLRAAPLLLACSFVATTMAPIAAQKPTGKKPAPAGVIVDGELGKDLDERVLGFDQGAGGFSGVVLVARDGKVVLEKGYGLHDAAANKAIDPGSLWDWASVTKQFTAAALLKLQDKKKMAKLHKLESA